MQDPLKAFLAFKLEGREIKHRERELPAEKTANFYKWGIPNDWLIS